MPPTFSCRPPHGRLYGLTCRGSLTDTVHLPSRDLLAGSSRRVRLVSRQGGDLLEARTARLDEPASEIAGDLPWLLYQL